MLLFGNSIWYNGIVIKLNRKTMIKKIVLAIVVLAGLYFTFGADVLKDKAPVQTTDIVFEDMTGKAEIIVELQNFSFVPRNIKISKGTKINWINKDSVLHDVVADENNFPELRSELFGKDGSYSFIFDKAGTYPYHCTPHQRNMRGIIVVE